MSRYDKLASKATARPWSLLEDGDFNQPPSITRSDAALIVALVNAGPDIAALWDAAEIIQNWFGDEFGDELSPAESNLHTAVEALRSLFGGDAE